MSMSASQFKAQRPRKAGGSGKKGKVFLENKVSHNQTPVA
jgi:hypothetical protein